MKYVSKHSLITLGIGMSLAACAAEADDDDAKVAAPGVSAEAGEDGVSASAPGVSAKANKNGASAAAGPVDVTTAQLALDELSGNVDTTVDGFNAGIVPPPPDAQPVTAPGAAAKQNLSVTCASGGGADVDGYVNVEPAPVTVDVKLAIAYDNCATRNGTTINGDINFSQTVLSGPETPLQVETIYQGDVTLTGRVNASCPVDLNVLVDETGRAVKVEGTFCDQDASALNLQLQPRWQIKQ